MLLLFSYLRERHTDKKNNIVSCFEHHICFGQSNNFNREKKIDIYIYILHPYTPYISFFPRFFFRIFHFIMESCMTILVSVVPCISRPLCVCVWNAKEWRKHLSCPQLIPYLEQWWIHVPLYELITPCYYHLLEIYILQHLLLWQAIVVRFIYIYKMEEEKKTKAHKSTQLDTLSILSPIQISLQSFKKR